MFAYRGDFKGSIHPRTDAYRKRILDTKPGLSTARLRIYTEAYEAFKDEEIDILRAKSLYKFLTEVPIQIHEQEIIAGNMTEKPPRCGPIMPDFCLSWVSEIDDLATRPLDRLSMTDEDIAFTKETAPLWKGRSVFDKYNAALPEAYKSAMGRLFMTAVGVMQGRGHTCVNYDRLLKKGLADVKREAQERLAEADASVGGNYKKQHFYRAVIISCDAVIAFAHRYSDLAEEMAARDGVSAERREELLTIARMCRRVPEFPATTLHEALQSAWLLQIALFNEDAAYGFIFGRVDQLFYPFYQNDRQTGFLDDERALELLEQLYLKVNEPQIALGTGATVFYAGQPLAHNMILGGVRPDGTDATNELSYLCLEAEMNVRLPQPDLMIRVADSTPQDFLVKACKVAIGRVGKLKFLMDNTAIKIMESRGIPTEEARDYVLVGCMQPYVPGKDNVVVDGQVNAAKCLELALHNGIDPVTGSRLGPETGDPAAFATFDDLFAAYNAQVASALKKFVGIRNIVLELNAEYVPIPLQSAMVDDCLSRGRDLLDGGGKYSSRCVLVAGIVNVGDSLGAINRLVYENKELTLSEMIAAVDADFEGYDDLLAKIAAVPKFGNDDDYADAMQKKVTDAYIRETEQYYDHRGSQYTVALAAVTTNVPYGKMCGALPDGRKAGLPLAEGGISPYQGRNVNGPLATLKSVAKLDLSKARNGSVLNIRFSPQALDSDDKVEKMANMLRANNAIGGYLVQFNIVDTETLRAAQKDPEAYQDLTVRVATYSSLFVELSTDLQNDIINRLAMEEV